MVRTPPPGESEKRLVAPLRIVVDEAGDPTCRADAADGQRGGFIACAAAIPETIASQLVDILPRGPDGKILKSSDHALSPKLLQQFLEELPIDQVTIALVGISTNSTLNLSLSERAARAANFFRAEQHRQKIRPANLLRWKMDVAAIVDAWGAHSVRQAVEAKKRAIDQQRILTPFEDWTPRSGAFHDSKVTLASVTIDEGNHNADTRSRAPQWFGDALARQDVKTTFIRWCSEAEEPLIAIPDLLAGMLIRHRRARDLPDAVAWFKQALDQKRINFRDGIESRIPDVPVPGSKRADG